MAGTTVTENLEVIRDRIDAACRSAGRSVDEVKLVAVSKRIALPLVVECCAAGQWELGENRVDEALERQKTLPVLLREAGLDPAKLRWHFIGHLQGNKAGKAAGRFEVFHGVHSAKLAGKLARLAEAEGRTEKILLEVNISGEEQKHGVAPDKTVDLVAQAASLPGLEILGLMGMARYGADDSELRQTFASLRRLSEDARKATGLALPELSMGMSGDYEAAVAEGSTLIRVGGALFGPRQ
jgi:pyridoxal phosphate enzyme (YggS family)